MAKRKGAANEIRLPVTFENPRDGDLETFLKARNSAHGVLPTGERFVLMEGDINYRLAVEGRATAMVSKLTMVRHMLAITEGDAAYDATFHYPALD